MRVLPLPLPPSINKDVELRPTGAPPAGGDGLSLRALIHIRVGLVKRRRRLVACRASPITYSMRERERAQLSVRRVRDGSHRSPSAIPALFFCPAPSFFLQCYTHGAR
jgi:hypothetical protein